MIDKSEKLKKEIKKLKDKVYKKLKTRKCPKYLEGHEKWEEFYEGGLIELNAELKGLQEGKQETPKQVKEIMFGKIDWIQVFKDAYESRKTAWVELGHIQEWRNATDEVLFAVWKQLEKEIK